MASATPEITSISITPAENGCTVRVSTRIKTNRKAAYDGFDYTDKIYVGDADLFGDVMKAIGADLEEDAIERGEDAGKPETNFDAKKFK